MSAGNGGRIVEPGGGTPRVVSLATLLRGIRAPWEPAEVARVNESVVRIARLDGAFEWHHHDEDEMFLCWEGAVRIELRGSMAAELSAGDIFVVAKGVEHRPVADAPAVALVFERAETRQYGN